MKTYEIWGEQWTDADINSFLEELHENNLKHIQEKNHIRTANQLRKTAFKMVQLGRWTIWEYIEWCNRNHITVF